MVGVVVRTVVQAEHVGLLLSAVVEEGFSGNCEQQQEVEEVVEEVEQQQEVELHDSGQMTRSSGDAAHSSCRSSVLRVPPP